MESMDNDGFFIGRTSLESPDVDPVVFLSESEEESVEPLAVGQMRTCLVTGASLADIEAHPIR